MAQSDMTLEQAVSNFGKMSVLLFIHFCFNVRIPFSCRCFVGRPSEHHISWQSDEQRHRFIDLRVRISERAQEGRQPWRLRIHPTSFLGENSLRAQNSVAGVGKCGLNLSKNMNRDEDLERRMRRLKRVFIYLFFRAKASPPEPKTIRASCGFGFWHISSDLAECEKLAGVQYFFF